MCSSGYNGTDQNIGVKLIILKIALPAKVDTNISNLYNRIYLQWELIDNLKHAMQNNVEFMTKVKDYNFKLFMSDEESS